MSDRAHRSAGCRRAARRRPHRSGRVRALLCLGVIAALGAGSTFAYWTDEGTVTLGSISSGTLDLTAGPSTGQEGLAGTGPNNYDYTAFTIADMLPGESISRTLVLRNSGSTPFRFNATVATTDNNLTSGTIGLQVQIYDNTTAAAATGSQAAGNRGGPCTSTSTLLYSGYPSTTASANVWSTVPSLVATGNTRSVCVRAVLSPDAPNALQGKTTKVRLNFTATQLGAP